MESMDTLDISGEWHSALGLIVSGANAVEFLQGYLTSNLERLGEVTGQKKTLPMSLCNLKGRVIVSGWVHQHSRHQVELLVHHSLTQKLQDVLTPYARFSRCALSLSANPPYLTPGPANAPGIIANLCVSEHRVGVDISDQIERQLIKQKFAWITSETSERFLPQALGLHHQDAVDFDKGCYLGQEIVARAQFRGKVKKELTEFTWAGKAPAVGAQNDQGDIVIAVTTSAGENNKGVGLAIA